MLRTWTALLICGRSTGGPCHRDGRVSIEVRDVCTLGAVFLSLCC
jgi:hypothetical protein